MNDQLIQAIAAGVTAALKQNGSVGMKAPTGTVTTNWIHGPGGIFGVAGSDQDVISARMTPRGISSRLQVTPDNYTHPLFPYITGIEESSGQTEPSSECETCISGETESCYQSAPYGFVCRETKELTPNRAIERINRGEVDLNLVNDILGLDMNDPWMTVRNMSQGQILQMATAWSMVEVGAMLQSKLVPMVWQGNPVNNVGTGYMEFVGLDTLIGTGKVDALTGTTCPALDSDVKDFNYQSVNTVDAHGNFSIVRLMEYMEAYVYHNADRQGLLPVEWAVVMRPELWYELTNVWPIAYLTTRNITFPTGGSSFARLNIDAARVRDMMDEMREGQFLFLNGRRHEVILDDGVYEYNSTNDENLEAGEYASNIYLVPLTYRGGRPATYLNHKDYRAAAPDIQMSRSQDTYWTDAGRFLWTVERQKWCYTLSAKVEPRIVLRTPQLAGRLNLVKYTPAQHFRSYDQDSDYFFKGGVASRDEPVHYPRSYWGQ